MVNKKSFLNNVKILQSNKMKLIFKKFHQTIKFKNHLQLKQLHKEILILIKTLKKQLFQLICKESILIKEKSKINQVQIKEKIGTLNIKQQSQIIFHLVIMKYNLKLSMFKIKLSNAGLLI